MKNCTKELRIGFINQLQDIQWLDSSIPVRSAMLNSNPGRPSINGLKFDAFITITNEFRGRNMSKNVESHKNSLTIDVVTSFSGESYDFAGQEWAEDLADIVNSRLFAGNVFKIKSIKTGFDVFTITDCESYNQPMPLQYTDTSRIFRVVTIFEVGIQHTVSDTESELTVITI